MRQVVLALGRGEGAMKLTASSPRSGEVGDVSYVVLRDEKGDWAGEVRADLAALFVSAPEPDPDALHECHKHHDCTILVCAHCGPPPDGYHVHDREDR